MLSRSLVPAILPVLLIGCVVASPPNQGHQQGGSSQGAKQGAGGNAGKPDESGGTSSDSGGTSNDNGGTSNDNGGTMNGTGGRSSRDAATVDSGPPGVGGMMTTPWVNVTNNLTMLASGGGDVSYPAANPNSSRIVVGVNSKGLFASDDGGMTWTALGTGKGSAVINNIVASIVFDPDHPETFWESGAYGDGVFVTHDNGVTFTRLGDIGHCDVLGIDFTDPDRKTLVVGAHEQSQKLYLSVDSGMTWTDIGPNFPNGTGYTNIPMVLDAHTFLVATTVVASNNGVWRSTDTGKTWAKVTDEVPWAAPLRASDGFIYWSVTTTGMIVSQDEGMTWTKYNNGPVQIQSGRPLELPDGRIVTLGSMNLLASSNHGKTWRQIGEPLPYKSANCAIYGVSYSAMLQSFFSNHNDCSGHILPDSLYTAQLQQ